MLPSRSLRGAAAQAISIALPPTLAALVHSATSSVAIDIAHGQSAVPHFRVSQTSWQCLPINSS